MTRIIERVKTFPSLPEVDDATRREFLFGAAGLLLHWGDYIGGDQSSGATRAVEDFFGRVELPRCFFGGGGLQESPATFADAAIWQNVPAVERGNVIELDSHAAFGSYGVVGLERMLDRLFEGLSG